MAGGKKRVKVKVDGKEITIVSQKSAAHIELVSDTINQQLADIKDLSTGLSKEEQMLLIAINAVSDQIDSHQQMLELDRKVKRMEEQS